MLILSYVPKIDPSYQILIILSFTSVLILLVSLMTNKNKLKLILGTSIVPIIVCLYLLYNDAFFSYIDFCYLGLGNFLDNFYFQLPIFIVMLIMIIILIIKLGGSLFLN